MGEVIKIQTEYEINDEMIDSILVTAFDGNHGGSWYWAKPGREDWLVTQPVGTCTAHGSAQHLSQDECVAFAKVDVRGLWTKVHVRDGEDPDDGVEYVVSGEVIALGIRLMLEQGWGSLLEAIVTNDGGMIDADLADSIVQYGLFQGGVYG